MERERASMQEELEVALASIQAELEEALAAMDALDDLD